MPSLFALEFLSSLQPVRHRALSHSGLAEDLLCGSCPAVIVMQSWIFPLLIGHQWLLYRKASSVLMAPQRWIYWQDTIKVLFFSILQLKLNMLIVPIISGTCCFISNTEICVLISQLMLVSIHGCTALVGGQNCDKIDRNFCNVCCIEPTFCQASRVTLKIIKQTSCN